MKLISIKLGTLLFVLALVVNVSFGQGQPNQIATWLQTVKTGHQVEPVQVFEPSEQSRALPVADANFVVVDHDQLASLMANKPAFISFDVPRGNDETVTLTLARVNPLSDDFSLGIKGLNPQENVAYQNGVHYRGIVGEDMNSIAALSFFENDVMGFYVTEQGNYTVAKVEDEDNVFAIYNATELPAIEGAGCFTADSGEPVQYSDDGNHNRGIGCKTVKVYFECDYALFVNKGSNATNVTNYVTGLFNQVATLYANENIDIQISQIYVWTTTDPYASMNGTSSILSAFRTNTGTNFNGNLAHFLTTRSIGGGIAYVDVICTKSYAFGVSMIYGSYSSVPTYSWSVEVVTHELGHNLGSPHTQSCSWTGGALDNCYAVEGSCSPGPAPINGGTIMSYCHLASYGINFNNGFGQQPGDLIRSRVLNASCLTPSGAAPTGLVASNITTSAATLAWVAVPGATTYTVQYKLSTSSTWITAGTTSSITYSLSGLTAGATYNWQVKTDCSSYASGIVFTTTSGGTSCAAPSSLAASNITTSSATLSWGAVSGASNYTVQYKLSSASIYTTLGTYTTTSASISGLAASTTYNWQVKASCSAGFSAASSFTTSASAGCTPPTGLTTTNIGSTSATLNWSPVSGATSYSIKYRKSTSNSWTNVNNITTNSKVISNLTPGITYQWRVKSNCNSTFSATVSFNTTTGSLTIGEPAGHTTTTLNLYPNPVQNQVNLLIDGWAADETGVAEVFNVTGALIKTVDVKAQENVMMTNELPAGVYFVYIRKEGNEPVVARFVKE